MWSLRHLPLERIGIEGSYRLPDIPSIPTSNLCVYSEKEKCLQTASHQKRVSLIIEAQLDHGSYGNVHLAKREDTYVLLKQPRLSEMNLLQEAVVQSLAHTVLEAEGIPWAIPKVYDVFRKGNEIWFSMDRIQGMTIHDWFSHTETPDMDTWTILAQISLCLACLEHHLHLDHRDLKVNNLLIKPEVCTLRLRLYDTIWTLQSPFQVILLDFGFACLGSGLLRSKPLVNLGDGVLPPMDPCPKEGRDIFHLLISFLGLPIFRQRVSQRIHEKIDRWLSVGTKSYGSMARRWSTENWSYLVSSQPTFSIKSCCPHVVLEDILPELKGRLTKT